MNETTDTIAEIAPNRQRAVAGLMRSVWLRTGDGSEDVDVGLDALIRVVDGLVDEPAPVVGALVQPVAGEPIGQPRSPGQHEALRDEQIDQEAGDEDRRQQREEHQRKPKAPYPRVFHRLVAGQVTLHGDRRGGVQVVALVAEQHVQPHPDDHRQQHGAQGNPRSHAVPSGEVRAGDGPELPAPDGEPGDENEHNECAERRDRPGLADPDQRIDKAIAPVDRRRERFELVHWNPTPASGDMVARKLPQVQFGGSGAAVLDAARANGP